MFVFNLLSFYFYNDQDQKGWRDWCRKGLRPADVPSHPDKAYKEKYMSFLLVRISMHRCSYNRVWHARMETFARLLV